MDCRAEFVHDSPEISVESNDTWRETDKALFPICGRLPKLNRRLPTRICRTSLGTVVFEIV